MLRSCSLFFALIALIAMRPDASAQRKKRGKIGSKAQAMRGQGVPEGKVAPTFELKLLKTYDLPKTKDGKTRKTIKLTDYRSKKPVVLIFGSYT